jgi:hypothetical protein
MKKIGELFGAEVFLDGGFTGVTMMVIGGPCQVCGEGLPSCKPCLYKRKYHLPSTSVLVDDVIDEELEKIAMETIFPYEAVSQSFSILKDYTLVRAACRLSSITGVPLIRKQVVAGLPLDVTRSIYSAIYG